MTRKRIRSYEKVKSRYGYVFISIWLVGFLAFFLTPFITSIVYSFCDMEINPGDVRLTFVGFANYAKLFVGDTEFMPAFTETFSSVVVQTPLINIFALFIAIILNQKFHGRLFARAVFFLPVIIASGVVMNIINGDQFLGMLMSGQRSSMMFEANTIKDVLQNMGFDQIVSEYIMNTVNQIFYLSWSSGIQILIFLSGLQSISPSLYEVAKVEGANAWVSFWKITLPMIAPMILVNLIYTIIDNFINYSNSMFQLIQKVTSKIDFSYAAAMAAVNFIVIFLLIAIVYALLNRRIYYAVD